MYRYQFNKFRDEDAMSFCGAEFSDISAGTLIMIGESYYLCLGDSVSRPELTPGRSHLTNIQIICQLCSESTISLIHWMVNERYTSYRDVLPLFFGSDISLLLKYKPKIVKSENGKAKSSVNLKQKNTSGSLSRTVQIVEIFPSLFSMMNNAKKEIPNSQFLTGNSTSVQRAKAYRAIQSGQISHVFATHSQIFRDRGQLSEIILHDADSSFYQIFQEPRYKVKEVVGEMRRIHGL